MGKCRAQEGIFHQNVVKKNEKDDGNYIPALSAQGKRLEVCAKVSTEVNSGYRPFV